MVSRSFLILRRSHLVRIKNRGNIRSVVRADRQHEVLDGAVELSVAPSVLQLTLLPGKEVVLD